MKKYVGFYWTLPITWAGFYELPRDLAAAAKKSKTIAYQMNAVRREVKLLRGDLIREFKFVDTRPDAGTDAVELELEEIRNFCEKESATLIYVDFSSKFGWRPHLYLERFLWDNFPRDENAPYKLEADDSIIEHFRRSREIHLAKREQLRTSAIAELLERAEEMLLSGATYQAIGDQLNRDGIKTSTGRDWTKDTVRKTLKALELSPC